MQHYFIIINYNLNYKIIVEKKLNKNGDIAIFLQKNRAKP
jgi:hypothetical protein